MIIDAHAHVEWPPNPAGDRAQVEGGDALGIDVFVCSCLAPRPSRPETFREANDRLIAAISEFPGRIWGYCYVNPGFTREALAEIDRCLQVPDILGVKLYNEYFFNEPVLRPIIELCLERDVPILEHQGHCTDPTSSQPRISDASHLAQMANEYPEAKLILGHICGGGDWEWTIKQTASAPSLWGRHERQRRGRGRDRARRSGGRGRTGCSSPATAASAPGSASCAEPRSAKTTSAGSGGATSSTWWGGADPLP